MSKPTDTIVEFTVHISGKRLDKLIVPHLPDYSRNQIQQMIDEGRVRVDGDNTMKPGNRLKGGEEIRITLPEDEDERIEAEVLNLDVLYEDEHIAVINKRAGMVMHPAPGHDSGTLVHGLLARYPEISHMQDDPLAEGRMGIVHRLDKDTSGVIVTARHIQALHDLMRQFKERTVEKTYLALLERAPDTVTGLIDAPIAREPANRQRMGVVRGGKHATTEYEVIDDDFREGQVLVRVRMHTGRTHQIRVHMAFIGCPVVGDTLYGFSKQRIGLKRNFLHAAELGFDHPDSGERRVFDSELPAGLQDIMRKLR